MPPFIPRIFQFFLFKSGLSDRRFRSKKCMILMVFYHYNDQIQQTINKNRVRSTLYAAGKICKYKMFCVDLFAPKNAHRTYSIKSGPKCF